MRSHPQETVLHELLQRESSSQGAALRELLQCESFPWAAVLQEQAAPVWVPHRVTSPVSKPVPLWAPLSTGPQVLAGASSSMGSPQGHILLWASHCSGVVSCLGCRWGSAPPRTSMSCRGQPASPWSPPWAAGEPLLQHLEQFLPSLGSSEFSLLFPTDKCPYTGFFFSLLKYVITEVLPSSLMGSTLASSGSVLEPVALAALDLGESSGSFSQQPPQ